MKIQNYFMISKNNIYIIAEIGVNHNGNLDLAKKLIISAKKSGADAVKFQNFTADNLAVKNSKKAPYQIKNTKKKESQYIMLKKLELKKNDYFYLKDFCIKKKIEFISSVFDEESVDFLSQKLKVNFIKVPSGEITNYLILKKLQKVKNKIILSTGMANVKEIIESLNIIAKKNVFELLKNGNVNIKDIKLHKKLKEKVILLHCVTDYPVDEKYANLSAIDTLQKKLKLDVGYSDHTLGILAPLIAASKGAKVIEKHLTLNKKMPGPDHKASLEPDQFKKMIDYVREFEVMNGNGEKILQKCEVKNINIARKSIVAKKFIKKNEVFSYFNLTTKRPGNGLSPMNIKKLINKKAKKNFQPDELIRL